jgi:hypothetical protein
MIGSSYNSFKDLLIENSIINSIEYSYLMSPGSVNINNAFLNCSYDTSKESVYSGHTIIRKWYYTAYVNDTLGANVSGANITAYNRTGSYNFNLTTGSDGLTPQTTIIDYINNAGTRTYYSPYNIYAINSTYLSLNQSWNVTAKRNTRQDFTLGCWSKTGTGRGSILYIRRGCLYQIPRGVLG